MNNRDSIFVSHANPEDNYFATWLTSKLAMMGYKVWVDKKAIRHGSYFTLDYEKEITENTVIFLCVITKNYLKKINTPDSGVFNELYKARTFKETIIRIPLMLESIGFNELPSGLIGLDACSFENWGKGLKDLIKWFKEKGLKRDETLRNPISLWYEAQNIITKPFVKEELYYSNWFNATLPQKIRIARGDSYNDYFSKLKKSSIVFTEHSGYIVTFSSIEEIRKHMSLYDEYEFEVEAFLTDRPIFIHDKLSFIEPNKLLVRLLNKTLKVFLYKKGLRKYESISKTSKKNNIFHFVHNPVNKKMVDLSKFGKSRRAIMGGTSDFYWHFGISYNATLDPFIGFKIRYHLIFTDSKQVYLSKDDQHELRRSVPKTWFNRKWFEMMLAMMYKISDYTHKDYIRVFYDENDYYRINILPINVECTIGYNEPNIDDED